jgi:hypothetical protein
LDGAVGDFCELTINQARMLGHGGNMHLGGVGRAWRNCQRWAFSSVKSDMRLPCGWEFMRLIIEYAEREGAQKISRQVLENATMLAMCEKLGFSFTDDPDDFGVTVATLAVGTEPAQNDTAIGTETT